MNYKAIFEDIDSYGVDDIIRELETKDISTLDELVNSLETLNDDGIINELADSDVDVYTADLLRWLQDNYVVYEDAMDELGHVEPNDLIKDLMAAQWWYKSNEINDTVNEMIDCVKSKQIKGVWMKENYSIDLNMKFN